MCDSDRDKDCKCVRKYILFKYGYIAPIGGLHDIAGSFDTIEQAKEAAEKHLNSYNEIVDRDTWEFVCKRDLGMDEWI